MTVDRSHQPDRGVAEYSGLSHPDAANPPTVNFLDLLFPPDKIPEAPPPDEVPKGARGAILSPNATGNRLDTPHDEARPRPVRSERRGAESRENARNQDVQPSLASGSGSRSDAPSNLSSPGDASSSGDCLNSAAGTVRALPTDADAPITRIESFRTQEGSGDVGAKPAPAAAGVQPGSAELAISPMPSDVVGGSSPLPATGDGASPTPFSPSKVTKSAETGIGPVLPAKAEFGSPSLVAGGSAGASAGGSHAGSTGNPEFKRDESAGPSSLQRNAKVADVVAKFETMMATRPQNGVTVELSPKSLGHITFTLKASGKSVDTQFVTANEQVRHALFEAKGELSAAMSHRGYTLSGIGFSSGSGDTSAGGSSEQRSPTSRFLPHEASKPGSPLKMDGADLPLSDIRRLLGRSASGVDLWI